MVAQYGDFREYNGRISAQSYKAYCILFPPFRDAHFLFIYFFSFVLSPVFFHTCDLYVRSLSVSLFNYGFDRYSWQLVSCIFSSLEDLGRGNVT